LTNIASNNNRKCCMQYSTSILLPILYTILNTIQYMYCIYTTNIAFNIVQIVRIVHIADASNILLLLSSIASNLVRYHEIRCFIVPKLL
jgi:hypothetical protein